MKLPLKSIGVIILERGKESSIASTIYKLRIGIDEDLGIRSGIYVIDNGSYDETAYVANMAGAGMIRYKQRKDREVVINKAVGLAVEKGHELTVILDRMGGLYAEDALALINAAVEKGKEFATAYVVPTKGEKTIGCLAVDRNQLLKLKDRGEEVSSYLLSLSGKEKLKKVTFRENVSFVTKKKQKNNNGKKPILIRLRDFRRNHPLKFYGSLGLMVLLNAIGFGMYTIDHFYHHRNLYYPTSFATVFLVMVAGFLLVSGLMLNALTVMLEKVKATKKWEKEKQSRDRRICE